jgi:hypothetical protein
MTNLSRPSTSCQIQRPSLTDDEENGKHLLSKSLVFEGGQTKQQQRLTRPSRPPPPPVVEQQQQPPPLPPPSQQPPRLGRSLLSNDNWRQETMADVRVNAKIIEQSDQNILFGKGEI